MHKHVCYYLLLVILLSCYTILPAQDEKAVDCNRWLVGVMVDEETGEAMIGVTVVVKGTTRGVSTDLDGAYQLKVCLGDVIVFHYVGYESFEVIMTKANTSPTRDASYTGSDNLLVPERSEVDKKLAKRYRNYRYKPQLSIKDFVQDTTYKGNVLAKGSVSFSKDSPRYHLDRTNGRYLSRKSFKKGLYKINAPDSAHRKGGYYQLVKPYTINKRSQFDISWTGELGIGQVGKLPETQQTFAQGTTLNGGLTWLGSENNVVSSWGPRLSDLEYDGVPNAYQLQGDLVPTGTGNGEAAQAFDPLAILRTTLNQKQQVHLTYHLSSYNTNYISLHYQNSQHYHQLFPEINDNQHDVELRGLIKTRWLTIQPMFQYVSSSSFLARGGAMSNLMASTLLTPISFDNAGGNSVREAIDEPVTYRVPDGSFRRFSGNGITGLNNPYALLRVNPNQENIQKITAASKFWRATYKYRLEAEVGWSKVVNEMNFGNAPTAINFESGRLTERREEQHVFDSQVRYLRSLRRRKGLLVDVEAVLSVGLENRFLNRRDGNNFELSEEWRIENGTNRSEITFEQNRLKAELISKLKLADRQGIIEVTIANQTYTSSTKEQLRLVTPAISVEMNLLSLSENYNPTFSDLRVFGGYNRRIKEVDLSYQSFHYNSTSQAINRAFDFSPVQELRVLEGLNPQEFRELEVGFVSDWWGNTLVLNANFFHRTTRDAIYPAGGGFLGFQFQNIGIIQNSGLEVELGTRFEVFQASANEVKIRLDATFNRSRPVLKELDAFGRVSIAGFSTVFTGLVEGEPVGVIMGRDYSRNEAGQLIIGADGFPTVGGIEIIGNPNPDFTGTFSQHLEWRTWSFNATWSFSKGGDQWNGTQQLLDFFGRSASTAELRNTTDYIFDGVLVDGRPNTQEVDFYDPTQPLEENRWVRYGIAGINSDYIQDASSLRLSEVQLSYRPNQDLLNKLPFTDVRISLYARNLFLMTAYTGVDPDSRLFGYTQGAGLDFFNTPTNRQYGMRLYLKL